MMFVEDIVLGGENREDVDQRLNVWRFSLEGKGLRISRYKAD